MYRRRPQTANRNIARASALVLASVSGFACQQPSEMSGPESQPPAQSPATMPASGVPVPGRYLDRASPAHAGVLQAVNPDGTPVVEGPEVDSRILEARRFYDTVQAPGAQAQALNYPNPFAGGSEGPRKTAPLTLDAWKTAFGFSPRQPDETLDQYRTRAGVAVYYNRNELGLGRELGCSEFEDGRDASGAPLIGVACYVSNFGRVFNDEAASLALAVEGKDPRNTVCITYRPSLGPGYEVQFYVYGPQGRRQDWAQLDSLGPRPHPHVCMNCHGGSYDSARHLVKNARFLPLDPNMVAFAPAGGARDLSRAGQEESMRAMNAMALRTPLTPGQKEMLHELYDGKLTVPGQVSQPTWIPQGWRATNADAELFDQVVKPYCATCHLALYQKDGEQALPSYDMFTSSQNLRRFPMAAVICGTFTMPNAQPTMAHFWEPRSAPIVVGGNSYAAPADALLAAFGGDRASCIGLATMSTCNRGADPDLVCGDVSSGVACNRSSGRCVPQLSPEGAAISEGFCRMDGSRRCPSAHVCTRADAPTEGLESFDGRCVRR